MKTLLLIAFILTSFSSFAASERSITKEQEQRVLKTIDDICGDTWCEGDYGFRFNAFKCDKKSSRCQLRFQFIKVEDNDLEVYSSEQVCEFKNITRYDQIMSSEWGLADDFYQEVSDCISDRERAIRF